MMTSTSAIKESLNIKNQKLLNEINSTLQDEKEVVVLVGKPVSDTSDSVPEVPNVKPSTCYHRCIRADGSVYSRCSFFSIVGYISYMSILACTSICSFACGNSVFSVLSVNSVASVASVNSVLSIGSVNCFECVFNIPIKSFAATDQTSDTCNKYSLVDEADEDHSKLLYGLTYRTFQPTAEFSSEEDLVNDCCRFVHSAEARKHKMKGFVLNANRTACLIYSDEKNDENGEATLGRADVDTVKYVYKPCPPGETCK